MRSPGDAVVVADVVARPRCAVDRDHGLAAGCGRTQAVSLGTSHTSAKIARALTEQSEHARTPFSILALVRLLIFHGYLLRGTGSNVYNAELAAGARARSATRCTCCARKRDAVRARLRRRGRALGGRPRWSSSVRRPAGAGAAPSTGRTSAGLLPVYVYDRYEGFEVAPVRRSSTDDELDRYLGANVAAVREVVAALAEPDVALANHLVMGPAILARALDERALRGQDPRLGAGVHRQAALPAVRRPTRARASCRRGPCSSARATRPRACGPRCRSKAFASARSSARRGSTSTPSCRATATAPPRSSTASCAGSRPPSARASTLPPRRRSTRFATRGATSRRAVRSSPRCVRSTTRSGIDAYAPHDLAAVDPRAQPIVCFVGKLIVSKGIDLLIAAWPLRADEGSPRASRDRRLRDLSRGRRGCCSGVSSARTSAC